MHVHAWRREINENLELNGWERNEDRNIVIYFVLELCVLCVVEWIEVCITIKKYKQRQAMAVIVWNG